MRLLSAGLAEEGALFDVLLRHFKLFEMLSSVPILFFLVVAFNDVLSFLSYVGPFRFSSTASTASNIRSHFS